MAPYARIGWLWFVVPLTLLGYEMWDAIHTEFLGFGFYFVVWGGLLILTLCGAWFLLGMPGAKWVLRVAH
jgi:hypothetical protein